MSRKALVPFVLPADPVGALEATTKQYADGLVVISATDPIGTTPQAELWIDTVTNPPAAPLASGISFSPTGTIAATNVQSAVAEVANEAPRGIIAWKQGALAGQGLTTTPLTIATVAAALVAGRMYELVLSCRALAVSGALYVYFSSTVITGMPQLDDYIWVSGNYNGCTIKKCFTPPSTTTYTYVIKANVNAGTGGIWNDQGGGVWINDIGLAVASQ